MLLLFSVSERTEEVTQAEPRAPALHQHNLSAPPQSSCLQAVAARAPTPPSDQPIVAAPAPSKRTHRKRTLLPHNATVTTRNKVQSCSKRQSTDMSESSKEDNTPCLSCRIAYSRSAVPWWQCCRCLLWACGRCAHMPKKKTVFTCKSCM